MHAGLFEYFQSLTWTTGSLTCFLCTDTHGGPQFITLWSHPKDCCSLCRILTLKKCLGRCNGHLSTWWLQSAVLTCQCCWCSQSLCVTHCPGLLLTSVCCLSSAESVTVCDQVCLMLLSAFCITGKQQSKAKSSGGEPNRSQKRSRGTSSEKAVHGN